MKRLMLASALCLLGCVPASDKPQPKPDNDAVLSAVLESVADVIEIDGGIERPRITNTSHVTQYLLVALKYKAGDEDIFRPGWLSDYNGRYASQFEPAGEAVPLTDDKRRAVVEFLKSEAGAIQERE